MSFYRNCVSNLSGLDQIASTKPSAAEKANRLFRLHPTDHRNKGQVAVADSHVANIDYCTSQDLHSKATASFRGLADLAKR